VPTVTFAAKVNESIRAAANPWDGPSVSRTFNTLRAIGNIVATVAVFERKSDAPAVSAPRASSSRAGLRVGQSRESSRSATRLLRPVTSIALARIKLPMKSGITGSPNPAKARSSPTPPKSASMTIPKRAVMPTGNASVAHKTTVAAKIVPTAR